MLNLNIVLFLSFPPRVWPPPLPDRSWKETVQMNWSLLKGLQSMWSLPDSLPEGCSAWCGSQLSSASSPSGLKLREGTSPALTMWLNLPFTWGLLCSPVRWSFICLYAPFCHSSCTWPSPSLLWWLSPAALVTTKNSRAPTSLPASRTWCHR